MLRIAKCNVIAPETIEGIVSALSEEGAVLVAGGTDILPNVKHRLHAPKTLVSTSALKGFNNASWDDDFLRLGAGRVLSDISSDEKISAEFPSLTKAAGFVASPLLRNMGTIGGNVNLDTRCRYVNQTHFWRQAIGGGCLKSEGDVCHVVPGGKSCVAAMSSDCVPVLISLDAELVLVGPDGERSVALADYYHTDGIAHTHRKPGEITTEIRVPRAKTPRRTTYVKWTVRKSIDFPLLSCALRFDLASDSLDAEITDAKVVLGVMAAKPKILTKANALVGKKLSDKETVDALCELVYKQGKPLDNVPYEAEYRRKMLPVYVRRALAEWSK